MGGTGEKGKFPLGAIIGIVAVIAIIVGGYFYYTTMVEEPEEREDIYGPQLEALNNEIYHISSKATAASARSKLETIENEITDDPFYNRYMPLVEAQKAVLDVIDIEYLYYDETDEYAESGVDCSKDYDELISTFEGAESEANNAKYEVNNYLYENEGSTAEVLLTRVDAVDVGGMGVFLEILDRDYTKSCIEPEAPTGTYTTPLSKEDAISLVLAEVVGENNYFVYMVDEPLASGTLITIPRPEGDYNLTLEEEIWFFYVDESPFAPFAHSTKLVLVSVATAEYTVYDEEYYPIIDGVSYWSTYEERINADNIIYPEEPDLEVEFSGKYEYRYYHYSLGAPGSGVPVGTPVPFDDDLCCEGVEKKKYALVVTGYDEDMFKADTKNTYTYLKGQGYSDGDINFLTAQAGEANSDGQTTIANVAAGLNNIIRNAKCCDEVFIYISGHGASVMHWQYKHKTTNETKWITNLGQLTGGAANWENTGNRGKYHRVTLNPRFTTPAPGGGGGTVAHGSADGGRAWSHEFAAYLNNMDSCYITFMYFSCFSGTAAPTLAGKGRTIITPTGDTEAWGRGGNFGSYFTNWFIEGKGKGGNRTVDKDGDGKVSDKEAFDYAKGKTTADATAKNRTQEGSYTEALRCRCCHVICDEANDYLCKAVEGDGTDSPLCPKVGDYCGPVTTPPPEDHMECVGTTCVAVPGAGEDTCMTDDDCVTEEPPEDAVCGDGVTTSPEECDYGSPTTNKCEEGKYCTQTCECKELETSVVCGDGKISSPFEDCDGGNVITDICPDGYECNICKCEPIEAWCGDGKIDPPEECDHGNSATEECEVTGEVCQNCQCIPREEATHRECVDEACVPVQGYGEDQCYSDSQCERATHNECIDDMCVEVDGEGTDRCQTNEDCEDPPECGDDIIEGYEECEYDEDCLEGELCFECLCFEVPAYCGNGVIDSGEECEYDEDCGTGGVCGSLCRCVYPPVLDCDYICTEAGYPENHGQGFSSSSECGSYVQSLWLPPPACNVGCSYSFFYKSTNIAGETTCCCGDHEYIPCGDCSSCPDPETVCTAH